MPMLNGTHRYNTAIAADADQNPALRAVAYWSDLLELLPPGTVVSDALHDRYMTIVRSIERDQYFELRGFVDAVAVMYGMDKANFEWLCDAFDWVLA